MKAVDYSLQVYSMVDSISKDLREVSDEQLSHELEEEFGIEFYPLESDSENKFEKDTANEYLRAGFAMSSLLAEDYSRPKDTFFQERATDFREFEQELGDYGNSILTDHLVQYANLYSEIADEEDVELSHSLPKIALMNKIGKKDAVLDVLKELEDSVIERDQEIAGL